MPLNPTNQPTDVLGTVNTCKGMNQIAAMFLLTLLSPFPLSILNRLFLIQL